MLDSVDKWDGMNARRRLSSNIGPLNSILAILLYTAFLITGLTSDIESWVLLLILNIEISMILMLPAIVLSPEGAVEGLWDLENGLFYEYAFKRFPSINMNDISSFDESAETQLMQLKADILVQRGKNLIKQQIQVIDNIVETKIAIAESIVLIIALSVAFFQPPDPFRLIIFLGAYLSLIIALGLKVAWKKACERASYTWKMAVYLTATYSSKLILMALLSASPLIFISADFPLLLSIVGLIAYFVLSAVFSRYYNRMTIDFRLLVHNMLYKDYADSKGETDLRWVEPILQSISPQWYVNAFYVFSYITVGYLAFHLFISLLGVPAVEQYSLNTLWPVFLFITWNGAIAIVFDYLHQKSVNRSAMVIYKDFIESKELPIVYRLLQEHEFKKFLNEYTTRELTWTPYGYLPDFK